MELMKMPISRVNWLKMPNSGHTNPSSQSTSFQCGKVRCYLKWPPIWRRNVACRAKHPLKAVLRGTASSSGWASSIFSVTKWNPPYLRELDSIKRSTYFTSWKDIKKYWSEEETFSTFFSSSSLRRA